jgi:PAS domain S-box-containing protein
VDTPRILIVEDETLVAKDMKVRLERAGWHVVGLASSGESALRLARETEPELVLMDIELQGSMDGIETATMIRSEVEADIVYITAHTDHELVERAKITEPLAYLAKPVSTDELRRTVELALYKHRMERKLRESEARYRAVVEDQTELICRFLPDGTLTFVNGAYCRYFQREADQLVGISLFELIPPEDQNGIAEHLASLEWNKQVATCEHRVIAPADEIRWQQRTDRAIFNDRGEITEFQSVGRDVTDRKRAEEELIRAKEDWERTFDSVPDLISIIDNEYRIVRINRALADRLDIAPEAAAGMTCYEAFHGTDEPPPSCPHAQMLLHGIEHTAEVHEPRMGGTFVVSASPIRDAEGNIEGCVHVARDITRQKKIEIELAETVRNLRRANGETSALLRGARAIAEHREFERSARGLFEACSRVIGAPAGYIVLLTEDRAGDEVLLLESGGLPCRVDPELPMHVRGLGAEVCHRRKAVYDNDFSSSEWMRLMPEGHVELSNMLCVPMIVHGEAVGLLGLANKPEGFDENDARMAQAFAEFGAIGLLNWRAMKALEESEEKYRLLFSKEKDAIVVTEADTLKFVDLNEAAEKLWGYSRGELLDMTAPQVSMEPEKTAAALRDSAQAEGGQALTSRHQRKDGTVFPVEISSVPFVWKGGRFVCSIIKDITERQQAQQFLVHTERLKAVADLASGVAHNFNNLLQIVIGGTHVALTNLELGNFSEMKSTLEEVLESSRFGADTVKRLQEFARAGNEAPFRKGTIFDLSQTVEQALEMSRPWWKTEPEKEGVTISLNRNLRKGCLVEGKENELFEVVVNLIKNAAEALPQGGEIRVRTAVEKEGVILQVQDDGLGVPAQTVGRIFEPFFTTKGFRGTGMGLASSYGIVRRHGGEILVESREGGGSRFTVRLPLVEKPQEETFGRPNGLLRQIRILVVDDQPPVVNVLKDGLEIFGQTVLTAYSGQEAIDMLKTGSVDLIICDLGMPGMNGWEVGKKVKQMFRENGVPKPLFIMLTGWSHQADQSEKVSESGVDAVLEKPVDMPSLFKAIAELIEKGEDRSVDS